MRATHSYRPLDLSPSLPISDRLANRAVRTYGRSLSAKMIRKRLRRVFSSVTLCYARRYALSKLPTDYGGNPAEFPSQGRCERIQRTRWCRAHHPHRRRSRLRSGGVQEDSIALCLARTRTTGASFSLCTEESASWTLRDSGVGLLGRLAR